MGAIDAPREGGYRLAAPHDAILYQREFEDGECVEAFDGPELDDYLAEAVETSAIAAELELVEAL